LAGNFPWSVIFGFIRGSKRHAKAEKTYNEYAGEEGCGFHGAVFYRHSPPGQTNFVVPAGCSRRRAGDAMRRGLHIRAALRTAKRLHGIRFRAATARQAAKRL